MLNNFQHIKELIQKGDLKKHLETLVGDEIESFTIDNFSKETINFTIIPKNFSKIVVLELVYLND